MKINSAILYILTSAAAVVLLLVVASVAALTNLAHASAVATVAKASLTPTNLTPAAPMASPASSTGEDIRDIRQPRHVPSPWFRVLVAAGVVMLIAAIAACVWLRRKRNMKLLPYEIALQHLEMARHLMHPEHAREYCFAASRIIRNYVEEQLHLHAPRLTTDEFLREIAEAPGRIAEAHRPLLCKFLQHCDLAKFAGWRYSQESLAEMHAGAIEFVQQSCVVPETAAAAQEPVLPPVNKP